MPHQVKPKPLIGECRVPGDKSISHRLLVFSALSRKESNLKSLLASDDVISSRKCLSQLGIEFEISTTPYGLDVQVNPKSGLCPADKMLDAGNSGTTIRLLTGLLSAQPFTTKITGDASLQKRPMARIINPLNQMGAHITGQENNRFAPLEISPAPVGLHGIDYIMPVASAQVKSAIMLATLFADGETSIIEPAPSRDHTERLLKHLGVPIELNNNEIRLSRPDQSALDSFSDDEWTTPGDFSSAAFFIAAAAMTPGSEIKITGVNLNPGRVGFAKVLQRIGANIKTENVTLQGGEHSGDIIVKHNELSGDLVVEGDEIPTLIDEIPVLSAIATLFNGSLTIRGAEELRAKESDRLQAIETELKKLDVDITTFEDGLFIKGNPDHIFPENPPTLEAHHDHRIAMALSTLNHISGQPQWPMNGRDWVSVSFPGFFDQLKALTQTVTSS